MKMHVAQSGKEAGYLVACPAKVACRISSEEDHMYFDDAEEAREWSDLSIAKENGGPFGEGISPTEEKRLAELTGKGESPKLKSARVREQLVKDLNEAAEEWNTMDNDDGDAHPDSMVHDFIWFSRQRYDRAIEALKRHDALESVEGLVNRAQRPEYIESIDTKHFDLAKHGSTFTDSRVSNTEDVLKEAVRQRGDLSGDDRAKLVEQGADPSSFLPPESGVRYLSVELEGTQSLRDTASMGDDETLTVVAKGGNDGRPASLSLVSKVTEQPKTGFATVIVGPDMDENKKPIPNTEVLWTLHPGVPTRGIRSDDLREKGLDDGSKISVKDLRGLFGKDTKVNTQLA